MLNKNTPLLSHVKELQRRCMWIVMITLICAFLAYTQSNSLLYALISPLKACYGPDFQLIYLNLTEGLFLHIKLAFYFGFIGTIPCLLWHIWAFVAPGLHTHEKPWALVGLFSAPLLFTLGASLAYYFIIPQAWKFLLHFTNASDAIIPQMLLPHAETYISLTMTLLFAFGICFELPLVLVLLGKLGVIRSESLKKKRRIVIVGMFIVGAILTPPDIVSQVGLSIPLIVFYEIAILIMRLIEKRERKND